MRWLQIAGWLFAVGVVIAIALIRPDLKRPADPKESRAAFEKARVEFEQKRDRREQEIDTIRNEGTLDLLRVVGRSYSQHLGTVKVPPQEEDFREFLELWRSHRDGQPFVILWGVDLKQLADGGAGHLLAWEQTAGRGGARCVLMADRKTAKVVPEDEFNKFPRAK